LLSKIPHINGLSIFTISIQKREVIPAVLRIMQKEEGKLKTCRDLPVPRSVRAGEPNIKKAASAKKSGLFFLIGSVGFSKDIKLL
jgi:hypothetical protein